jgi:hypothetical protein
VGHSEGLAAFNPSGSLLWDYITGDWVGSPVIGSDRRLYVGATRTEVILDYGWLLCLQDLIMIEPSAMSAGSSFSFEITLKQNINDAFDYYIIADTQFGPYTLYLNGRVEEGITALYRNVSRFLAPSTITVIPNVILPLTMGGKEVTFFTAVIRAGTVPPISGLSELSPSTQNVIMMDKTTVMVAP